MAADRTVDLDRVDRLWQCTRCHYFAFSCPWFTVFDEDGNEIGGGNHDCPVCGDSDWHWCGGDSRDKRLGYAQEVARGR